MGKATRWLKALLGMNKDKENVDKKSNLGDKKRWSFVKSGKESRPSTQIPAEGSDWMRSYIADSGKEQSKHAIAVATASAAAADAAVAAANAAVAVVRLTSQGRGGSFFKDGRERLAAAKIQAVFRGYLARKALRALKGLVKLQALVRGYLVRKRAAATLHSMQALFRAQTAIRSQRARRSMSNERKSQPVTRTRKSIGRFEDTRSEFHSKRLSSSYDPESPKIVEIDMGGPKSRSRRLSACMSEYCHEDHQYYYQVVSSPIPYCPVNNRQDFDWRFAEAEDYKFATAQNTPRFGCPGRSGPGPTTPAKSVCGDSVFRAYSHCPSYMANTQSFRAKVRSHSAPKQRPGPGTKKRLSLDELMASRASFSGVRMQRTCPHVEEDFES